MSNWKNVILIIYYKVEENLRKVFHLSSVRIRQTFQDLPLFFHLSLQIALKYGWVFNYI